MGLYKIFFDEFCVFVRVIEVLPHTKLIDFEIEKVVSRDMSTIFKNSSDYILDLYDNEDFILELENIVFRK